MLYVALAEAVAIVAIVAVFGNLLRVQIRQGARERDILVNQLLNAAGKPWQEAPADRREPEPEGPVLTAHPEQQQDW